MAAPAAAKVHTELSLVRIGVAGRSDAASSTGGGGSGPFHATPSPCPPGAAPTPHPGDRPVWFRGENTRYRGRDGKPSRRDRGPGRGRHRHLHRGRPDHLRTGGDACRTRRVVRRLPDGGPRVAGGRGGRLRARRRAALGDAAMVAPRRGQTARPPHPDGHPPDGSASSCNRPRPPDASSARVARRRRPASRVLHTGTAPGAIGCTQARHARHSRCAGAPTRRRRAHAPERGARRHAHAPAQLAVTWRRVPAPIAKRARTTRPRLPSRAPAGGARRTRRGASPRVGGGASSTPSTGPRRTHAPARDVDARPVAPSGRASPLTAGGPRVPRVGRMHALHRAGVRLRRHHRAQRPRRRRDRVGPRLRREVWGNGTPSTRWATCRSGQRRRYARLRIRTGMLRGPRT